jgi:hypothetical protein
VWTSLHVRDPEALHARAVEAGDVDRVAVADQP